MQLIKIDGLNDGEKTKLFEMAMGMTQPEQEVCVSAFSDEAIVKEFSFRLAEYRKKLDALGDLMEVNPIWVGWE